VSDLTESEKEMLIQRVKFVGIMYVSDEFARDILREAELKITEGFGGGMAGNVALRITSALGAEVLDPHVVYSPTSWWQHFKRDCFPQRLRSRFPVRYNRRELRKFGTVVVSGKWIGHDAWHDGNLAGDMVIESEWKR
jgi:hypothetical protein